MLKVPMMKSDSNLDLFGDEPKKQKRQAPPRHYNKEVKQRRRVLRERVKGNGAKIPKRNCRTAHLSLRLREAQTPLDKLKVIASTDYHLVVIENQKPTLSCQHCKTTAKPVLTDGVDVTCFDCSPKTTSENRQEYKILRNPQVLGDRALEESQDLLDYIEKRVVLEMLLESKEQRGA